MFWELYRGIENIPDLSMEKTAQQSFLPGTCLADSSQVFSLELLVAVLLHACPTLPRAS